MEQVSKKEKFSTLTSNLLRLYKTLDVIASVMSPLKVRVSWIPLCRILYDTFEVKLQCRLVKTTS